MLLRQRTPPLPIIATLRTSLEELMEMFCWLY
jgi:hypothetical protein